MIGDSLKNSIKDLDTKAFYRLCIGIFAGVTLILCILFFYYHHKLDALDRKLRRINQQREEAQAILQEHALVVEQRKEVDAILARDKNFKIAQYFLSIVTELGLTEEISKEPVVSDSDLNNGYGETQLDASFKEMDTKQVVDLLYKIEQNDRVYTKSLVLLKAPKAKKLDVTLTIATLQAKAQP